MVVVSHKAIREFCTKYPVFQNALEKWYREALMSDWSNFSDLKNSFNSVDSVRDGLFVLISLEITAGWSPEYFLENELYSFDLLEHIKNMTTWIWQHYK